MKQGYTESTGAQVGRLVVVVEKVLSAASRAVLHDILQDLTQNGGAADEVTFVAGMHRNAVLAAGRAGGKVFYNTNEYIPLWEMLGLVPWREVWLVGGGRAWKANAQDIGLEGEKMHRLRQKAATAGAQAAPGAALAPPIAA